MSDREHEPRSPRVARWFLRRLLGRTQLEDQGAELEELFRRRVERFGSSRAGLWYWRQLFGFVIRWRAVKRYPATGARGVPAGGRRRGSASVLESLGQDVRFGFMMTLRGLRRRPSFFVFVALIIGLGVAAASSVFSVTNALLLRPLPFEEPERLVWVARGTGGGMSNVTSRTSNLRDYREMNRSFEALTGYFAFFGYESYNLVGVDQPERLVGVGVAQNFLDVLGVRPLLGRNFDREESVWNGRAAAILTHGFWIRRFGGDPSIVGQSITLNDRPTVVVGVLPPTFDFASTFAPASRIDFLRPFPICDETNNWGNTLAIIGRLEPGATVESAQADLDAITARLREADPERRGLGAVVTGLHEKIAGEFRGAMMLLAAAAAVVLLVVYTNLSNLLLGRGHARRREMAIRSALGAGPLRLVRQWTVESLILAFVGGLVGVLLAGQVTRAVAGTSAISMPMLSRVSVDGTTLLFALVVTLGVGLLLGIVPALQYTHATQRTVIDDSSRGSTEGRRGTAVREGLVVGEVALACVLLVSGGLLLRSFLSVLDVELGFRPEGVAAWEFVTRRYYSDRSQRTAFFDDLIGRVEAIPGVDAAGLTDTPPLGRNRAWSVGALGAEYRSEERATAFPRIVDWRYLSVMGIPITAGRGFTAHDDDESGRVVVLNETAAETLFPGQDPLGQYVVLYNGEWEVIGIVGDVRHQSLEQSSGLEMYLPIAQMGGFQTLTMVVRSRLPLATLAPSVRAALREVDPTIPSGDYWTLESVVDRSISPRRFVLVLVGAFAGTGLALAALGIYAVLSFLVGQRIPEIGIRMALGESAAEVLRRVLGRTLVLAVTGVAIGAAAAIVVSRLMRSLLYGIGPNDVPTFAAVVLVLLAASAAAGFLPAWRASRTDPIEALRTS
jgi:putative ABC transport system permease protein